MRVAIFTDTYLPQINGVTNTLTRLKAYLDLQEAVEYRIFAPDFGDKEAYDNTIQRYYSMKFLLYPECRLSLPNFFQMNASLADFQPDVIHCITEINMGLSGIRYASQNNLPLITTFTTNFPAYMKYYKLPFLSETSWGVMRRIHNQADLTVCPSHETKRMLESKGINQVGVWGRGIDFEQFQPLKDKNSIKMKYGIADKTMLLYVGRVSQEKNLDILLEAYGQLKKKHGDQLALVVTGGGPLLEELQEKHRDIVFTGYLRGKDLTDIYASADIFTFPSTTETLGNVVLEAMASGVPVVGPAAGGLKDNIRDHCNGILVKPEDVDTFRDGIDRLIENPTIRKQLAHQARAFAKSKSWDRVFDSLIETYKTVIRSKKMSKVF